MHDDSNIKALFSGNHQPILRLISDDLHSDEERRVIARHDTEVSTLKLMSEGFDEDAIAQEDDLYPRVRELPLDRNTVEWRTELAHVRQEHFDLDMSISALESMAASDQILIARLKRKKLALRDQISRLEDKIRPDIIA
jgi:hypothetical protein